jgi:hypothetical protein
MMVLRTRDSWLSNRTWLAKLATIQGIPCCMFLEWEVYNSSNHTLILNKIKIMFYGNWWVVMLIYHSLRTKSWLVWSYVSKCHLQTPSKPSNVLPLMNRSNHEFGTPTPWKPAWRYCNVLHFDPGHSTSIDFLPWTGVTRNRTAQAQYLLWAKYTLREYVHSEASCRVRNELAVPKCSQISIELLTRLPI